MDGPLVLSLNVTTLDDYDSIAFEAVPREVIGLMRQLRKKLNPAAHFNSYKYSKEEYTALLKSTYAIMRFISKVDLPARSERIFNDLVRSDSTFDNLNNKQLDAVQCSDSFVFVNAGPGTGKTHLVAFRILHRLKSLPEGKNIVALSFTNLSAGELKSRVDELIISSSYSHKLKQIYSGTIHAFCLDQFRAYYEYTDDEKYNLSVIEEDDLDELKRILKSDKPRKKIAFLSESSDLILNDKVEELLEKKKLLTYDGILDFYLKALRNDKKFLKFTASNIEEIVIDEAQDLGQTYYEIFSALRKGNKTIGFFLVGDQRQNIYTFRGGSLDHLGLLNETNLFNRINLELCYRCPQTVLSYLNQFRFTNCDNPSLTNPQKSLLVSEQIHFSEHSNKYTEANYILEQIQELRQNGASLNDMAILSTNSYYFIELASVLNDSGLGFKILGGKKRIIPELKPLLQILRFLFGKSEFAIYQLVNLIFNEPVTLQMGITEILEYIEKYSNGPKEDILENDIPEANATDLKNKKGLGSTFNWASLKSKPVPKKNEIDAIWESLLNNEPEEEVNKRKYDLFHYLISKSSVIELDFLSSLNEVFALLEQNKLINEKEIKLTKELVDLCNELNIQDFKEFNANILSGKDKFASFFVHQTKIHSNHFEAEKEALTLSTVHSAKGLEWKYVFIPGMSNEVFPGYQKNINEERKLFYVAASRTKEKLFLTRPKQVSVRQYTFNKSRSPFILNDSEYLTYHN